MASLAREGTAVLDRAGIPSAALDAEVLLAFVLGVERPHLHAAPEEALRPEDAARYRGLVERRAERVPLPYLTGTQEFWSLRFHVSPAVLIPRPETEHLVEAFLKHDERPDPIVIDIGTGSGCLAVAVARERPGALVHATDVSEEVLAVARLNATDHDVAGRIAFYRGDLFSPLRGRGLEGRVDAVLSNPPYIGEAEMASLQPEIRDHEPATALSAGPDPLAVHRRLAAEAPGFLRPGGLLIVEIGLGQEAPLRALYRSRGRLTVTDVVPDLAGIPRAMVSRSGSAAP